MPPATPKWRFRDDHVATAIIEQNPWQASGQTPGQVPAVLAREKERPLGALLWKRLFKGRLHRYHLILGPRRVGKTTVMYQTVRHLLQAGVNQNKIVWFRLDHPVLMRQSLGDLVAKAREVTDATPENPVYLFFDELTYAKDWDRWLKSFYDDHLPIRIVGTSSATAAIRTSLQESGVGRWQEHYLGPYTLNEYLDLTGNPIKLPDAPTLQAAAEELAKNPTSTAEIEPALRRYLFTGGFPELLLAVDKDPDDEDSALLESQQTLRTDAIEKAIYKDIPQAYGVNRPKLLESLLYILAEQVSGLLSPTSICEDLDGMSTPTFEKYLSYLERAFLIFTLQNYSSSERSKQKRGKKLYFYDGAVRNAALQRGLAPASDPAEMGLLLENLLASHIHAMCMQGSGRLYHWRDGGNEVDLVLEYPDSILAIEVGTSVKHHRKGLVAFNERFQKRNTLACYAATSAAMSPPKLGSTKVGTFPLATLALLAGNLAENRMRERLHEPPSR